MKLKLEDQIPIHKIRMEVLSNTPDNLITSLYFSENIAAGSTHFKIPENIVTNAAKK